MGDSISSRVEGTEVKKRPLSVAILGAGAAGLCTAIKLRAAGIEDFTIFEKAASVGGTWRDNTYPGAGCDVPSMLYSYSFEPKPDWSRKFAPQPEIVAYFETVARKYRLLPNIRFNTEIVEAHFDEEEDLWRIRSASGEEFTANVLISGVGQLNRPTNPKIEGLNDFKGIAFHSARWNHDADLAGKRVGVIGNGASAIQFVP
ncbi:MAG TPA: 4-hydroxyacetophenone monooxygenase, partial [Rhodobiaceae bacterium]|nr:4-hydroxyacetophenone monooxygenase [Rhodobiaceae bacterium]